MTDEIHYITDDLEYEEYVIRLFYLIWVTYSGQIGTMTIYLN